MNSEEELRDLTAEHDEDPESLAGAYADEEEEDDGVDSSADGDDVQG